MLRFDGLASGSKHLVVVTLITGLSVSEKLSACFLPAHLCLELLVRDRGWRRQDRLEEVEVELFSASPYRFVRTCRRTLAAWFREAPARPNGEIRWRRCPVGIKGCYKELKRLTPILGVGISRSNHKLWIASLVSRMLKRRCSVRLVVGSVKYAA